tara:strand:- start:9653 stop:10918 length:1266 start_codon:yes stop_codon:yes gene_type:complete
MISSFSREISDVTNDITSRKYDVAIIGGGITGLSSALYAVKAGASVILLEKDRIGCGASGKSGGQLVTGVAPDIRKVIHTYDLEIAQRLWEYSLLAVNVVRGIVERHKIDCCLEDGHLLVAHTTREAEQLAGQMRILQENFGDKGWDWVSGNQLQIAAGSDVFAGGVLDLRGGRLDPAAYVEGLAAAAKCAGARIQEFCPALAVDSDIGAVETSVGTIAAENIILAVDGSLPKFVPEVRQLMTCVWTAQMVISNAHSHDSQIMSPMYAVADTRSITTYYRSLSDDGLLFGHATSVSKQHNFRLLRKLGHHLHSILPQWSTSTSYRVETGQIPTSWNEVPFIRRGQGRLVYAGGYSGQGIAWATLAGRILASEVIEGSDDFTFFNRIPLKVIHSRLMQELCVRRNHGAAVFQDYLRRLQLAN